MHKIFTPAGHQTIEHRPKKDDLDINTLLTILLTCYPNGRPTVLKLGNMGLAWDYAENPASHHLLVNMFHGIVRFRLSGILSLGPVQKQLQFEVAAIFCLHVVSQYTPGCSLMPDILELCTSLISIGSAMAHLVWMWINAGHAVGWVVLILYALIYIDMYAYL